MERLLAKSGKSSPGVLVITVVTSPYPRWATSADLQLQVDCHYCPNEPASRGAICTMSRAF